MEKMKIINVGVDTEVGRTKTFLRVHTFIDFSFGGMYVVKVLVHIIEETGLSWSQLLQRRHELTLITVDP